MTTNSTLVGQTLGKYKITEHLGRGGMAEVYKGYREDLDRTVAIKLMHAFLSAEQDFLFRFKREARAMAQMRHPNIVSVYDFDVYGDNTYYLVMEYIGGGTLKEKLTQLARDGQRLPLEQSVKIALEVAEALKYAHGREMVHRDIKPANIMLDENGKAILTDFGIVKLVGGQSMAYTATGALIGTPAYMSPEQALGKAGDARSDLYSLGILLFQMVAGQLPFSADTPLAVVMKHVNDPVPLPVAFNPEIPVSLQEIILKAMAKNPDDRYQSAGEMAVALRNVNLSDAPAQISITPTGTVILGPEDDTAAGRTSVSSTAVSPPGAGSASATIVSETVAAQTPPEIKQKLSPWLYVGGGLGLLAIVVIILFASGILPGGGARGTATLAVAVAGTNTSTPNTPTATSAALTSTSEPVDTPDVVASSVAAIAQTAEAGRTNTPTPSSTPTSTPTKTVTPTSTPTIDTTAAFLASCVYGVDLVNAYTYRTSTNSAPVGITFPMNWVLKNNGTCPWPAGLQWEYVTGEEFGYDSPIGVDVEVDPDGEITLKASLVSPSRVDAYESTWQLIDTEGDPFGIPLTFEVRTYIPPTATPAASPTPRVTATATGAATTPLGWNSEVTGCEYVGTEWRCRLTIAPYGGGGGPYTVWVFDAPQPAEYRGQPPFYHFFGARRCAEYIHEIKIQDDATGQSFSVNYYANPNVLFAGGCTVP